MMVRDKLASGTKRMMTDYINLPDDGGNGPARSRQGKGRLPYQSGNDATSTLCAYLNIQAWHSHQPEWVMYSAVSETKGATTLMLALFKLLITTGFVVYELMLLQQPHFDIRDRWLRELEARWNSGGGIIPNKGKDKLITHIT